MLKDAYCPQLFKFGGTYFVQIAEASQEAEAKRLAAQFAAKVVR